MRTETAQYGLDIIFKKTWLTLASERDRFIAEFSLLVYFLNRIIVINIISFLCYIMISFYNANSVLVFPVSSSAQSYWRIKYYGVASRFTANLKSLL